MVDSMSKCEWLERLPDMISKFGGMKADEQDLRNESYELSKRSEEVRRRAEAKSTQALNERRTIKQGLDFIANDSTPQWEKFNHLTHDDGPYAVILKSGGLGVALLESGFERVISIRGEVVTCMDIDLAILLPKFRTDK